MQRISSLGLVQTRVVHYFTPTLRKSTIRITSQSNGSLFLRPQHHQHQSFTSLTRMIKPITPTHVKSYRNMTTTSNNTTTHKTPTPLTQPVTSATTPHSTTLNIPKVKPTQEQQLDDFLGRTDHRPLTRVDQAAKIALRQSEQSGKLVQAGSTGKFYLISRLVFVFEAWTLLFFGGAFAYYIYNVLQYREDSPWDIAVRMWDGFLENSRQYRQIALGKTDMKEFREDILRDKLALNPDDISAKEELAEIEIKKARRARQAEIRKKEEDKAMAEWSQFSNDLAAEQQKIDLDEMQNAFKRKMEEVAKSGGTLTDEDLLAFIQEHNAAKSQLESEIKSSEDSGLIHLESHQKDQTKRRHFQ